MASNDYFETAGTASIDSADDTVTNLANGLSLAGGCSGLDLCGNPYGCSVSNYAYSLMAQMIINDN